MIRDPAILVLDEATSALDSASERTVQDAINAMLRTKRMTTIVIAHRLSTIRDADKIAVVSGGLVVEEGPHDELILKEGGVYRALVEMQTGMDADGHSANSSTRSSFISRMRALGGGGGRGGAAAQLEVEETPSSPYLGLASSDLVSEARMLARAIAPIGATAVGVDAAVDAAAAGRELLGELVEAGGGAAALIVTGERVDGPPPTKGKATVDVLEAGTKGKKDRAKERKKPKKLPLGWLWRLSRPEAPHFVTGLVGAACTGIAQPAIGYLLAELVVVFYNTNADVDAGIAEMRRDSFKWAMVFVVMGGITSFGAVLRQISFAVITERMVERVRAQAFRAVLRQHIGWFDTSAEHTAGALVNQLTSDCFLIKALTGERASLALSQLVLVGGGLYMSFDASWQLTLVLFATVPAIVLPLALQGKLVARFSERASLALVRAGSHVSESIVQLRTVRAFGLETAVAGRLEKDLEFAMRADTKKGIASGVGQGVGQGMILEAAAFQYFIGGVFFDMGIVGFQNIMTCLLVLIFMAMGMAQISRDASDKAEAMLAAGRVHALVMSESEIDPLSEKGARPSERASGRVELRDVHFAYPTRPDVSVYKGFNLVIDAGQTVALAGPSGCGKSTLVGLLQRFYDVGSGSLTLDGVDVRQLSVQWLRAQIGLVSQEPILFAGTIGWNIGIGRKDATREQVEAAARLANAHEFVSQLPQGYETQVGEKGIQLSGGQKQRVAIARAVVRDPAILVLDEATSALDAASERIVQEAIDSMLRTKHMTTIIIAHRLSTIRDADKIAVVSRGVVVEEGPHDELIERPNGVYRALVAHSAAHDDEG